MSMKIGELDYTDDFDYSKTVEKGGKNISLQIMFLIFIVSITLIVMNLMLAVTISKTENLIQKAKRTQAGKRINDLLCLTELNAVQKFIKEWYEKLLRASRIPPLIHLVERRQPILSRWKNKDCLYTVCIKSFDGFAHSLPYSLINHICVDKYR